MGNHQKLRQALALVFLEVPSLTSYVIWGRWCDLSVPPFFSLYNRMTLYRVVEKKAFEWLAHGTFFISTIWVKGELIQPGMLKEPSSIHINTTAPPLLEGPSLWRNLILGDTVFFHVSQWALIPPLSQPTAKSSNMAVADPNGDSEHLKHGHGDWDVL